MRRFQGIFAANLALLTITLLIGLSGCGQQDRTADIEAHKRVAAELRSNSLYEAAIDEYEAVLEIETVPESKASICYLIGRIYFEDLKNYREAAAWFVRAREYDPDASFSNDASKNLVASLEKIGNVLDARRQLRAASDIESQPADEDDVVVARIGDRDVYMSEIEANIELLPPSAQAELVSRRAKLEYIHQYVGVELLYNAAEREDFASSPEFQRRLEQTQKRMLVDRFITEKIMPDIKIDSVDVMNYYRANKDSLYAGQAFDSVRTRVVRDYQAEKTEAAYHDYIERLARAENVQFMDQNVK